MTVARPSDQIPRLAAAALAALLWLLTVSTALSLELTYPSQDARRLIAYCLPLVIGAASALWRNRALALFLFPTSLGAALIVAPAEAIDALTNPWAATGMALSWVGYLWMAGSWVEAADTGEEALVASRELLPTTPDRWKPFRGVLWPRVVVLVVLFAITSAAVPLDPALAANVAQSFGGGADAAGRAESGIVLCNLILFFSWCVLTYTQLISPALELEPGLRHLETQLQASLQRSRKSRRRRLARVAVALALLVLAALFLHGRLA
jgi:hypothetical protein